MTASRVEHVTCLGCGCGCDDLTVSIRDGRITQVDPACPVSRGWFGDGSVPGEILRSGKLSSFEDAVAEAVRLLLASKRRSLIYIGSDLSSQAQRQAIALADLLGSTVDTATSDTAATGILVAQRRGRAGATLGELKNRADIIVFWGVDPARRYPRFFERFIDPAGTHVPAGRAGRSIVSVSVGADHGPSDADVRLSLSSEEEIPALSHMRATLRERSTLFAAARSKELDDLLSRLRRSRYVVLVYDAEPGAPSRDPLRAEALIALTQALNQPTRAALIGLRAGGNRVGAETALTSQTGYPLSVTYDRGWPGYEPGTRAVTGVNQGRFGAVLLVGTADADQALVTVPSDVSTIVIGPRASRSPLRPTVAIDTGIAGIHEGGTAYRLDDVPLRLRPPLRGPRTTTGVLEALIQAVSSAPNPGTP